MPLWTIQLLGGFRAERGADVLSHFRTRKTGALLAYLALYRTKPHARKTLAQLFWPASDIEDPRHNFRMALSALRKQMEPPGSPAGAVIQATPGEVGLNPKAVTTDVALFEEALKTANKAPDVKLCIRMLERAFELYSGELLPDFDDKWVLTERKRLAQVYRNALQTATKAYQQIGDMETAIHKASQAVGADPFEEAIHQDLLRLYMASGRGHEALAHYRRLEQRLRQDQGTGPSEETRQIIAGLLKTRPEYGQETLPSSPLPVPPTRFVGRTEELGYLHLLLNPALLVPLSPSPCRLVTLTGPGGSGKTRLALEVSQGLQEAFGGAVRFVDLADLPDPRFLPETIAQVLSPQPPEKKDPWERIAAFFRGKPGLLVLDNFETLLASPKKEGEDAALVVAEMLKRLPEQGLLVTSRQKLGLVEEHEVPIPPLPVPPEWTETPQGAFASADQLKELHAYPGVEMFLDRMRRVHPDFHLSARNAKDVAAICRWLEGIPLAIELAAGQSGGLSPAQMRAALGKRFAFLKSRHKNVLPRHRTLYAALDWSYRLLPPELQRFWVRLSVFRGSWTLEAASTVCLPEPEEGEALKSLRALLDRSLVVEDPQEEPRFRMLQTLREFAGEQLTPEEACDLAGRHAVYFLRWADKRRKPLREDPYRQPIAPHQEDLNAAFDWLMQAGDVASAAHLANRLLWSYILCGDYQMTNHWLERLQERKEALPLEQYVTILEIAGSLALERGSLASAQSLFQASLAIWQDLRNRLKIAEMEAQLGILAYRQGDYLQAQRHHAQTLTIYRQEGKQDHIALALSQLGETALATGDIAKARAYYEESLRLRREFAPPLFVAHQLHLLGDLMSLQNDYRAARALLEESLAIRKDHANTVGVALCLRELGILALDHGEFARARALFTESLQIVRPLDKPEIVAHVSALLGMAACWEGSPQKARSPVEAGLAFWQARGHPRWIGGMEHWLAIIEFYAGHAARARALCESSLALFGQVGDRYGQADVQGLLGRVWLHLGDMEKASALLQESLALFVQSGTRLPIARSLEALARLAAATGKAGRAARLLGAAEALREILRCPLPPVEHPLHDRLIAPIRAALGEKPFETARAEGYRMSLNEMVSFARSG